MRFTSKPVIHSYARCTRNASYRELFGKLALCLCLFRAWVCCVLCLVCEYCVCVGVLRSLSLLRAICLPHKETRVVAAYIREIRDSSRRPAYLPIAALLIIMYITARYYTTGIIRYREEGGGRATRRWKVEICREEKSPRGIGRRTSPYSDRIIFSFRVFGFEPAWF